MIEEKLQRRLRRAVIVISCIIAALLVFGVCFAAFLRQAETEAVREQIIAEAEEYKSRILKQIDADFQTLATLAAFIERDSVSDRELLARRLKKANENNTFLTMTYYDTAGEGILTASGKETVTDASLSDLSPDGRKAVQEALSGNRSVSRLFQSDISDERVFVYSVPVYDGEISSARWRPAIISKFFPISCRAVPCWVATDISTCSVQKEIF